MPTKQKMDASEKERAKLEERNALLAAVSAMDRIAERMEARAEGYIITTADAGKMARLSLEAIDIARRNQFNQVWS